MKDFNKIDELYKKYGFECEESSEEYAVFSLSETIFPGVDIVICNDECYEDLRNKYAECGYSTNKVPFIDIESLDLNLYKRFLRPNIACKNMLVKYQKYITKIIEPYKKQNQDGNNNPNLSYSYINVDYNYEHNFKREELGKPIIEAILSLVHSQGPRLIIVEAAAGYGKTSTSQELLSRLCQDNNEMRPFLMELERDRQATTFRYLLLSQIDSFFEVKLKNDIVISNIKKGRIPLIIDGFDELLSKDIDKGREVISLNKVETMLSTIAELLEGNSKVILTTRKTAIFSGEQFTEWYEYQTSIHNRNFSIDRFQLHEARLEDWLSISKLKFLPETLKKISNPVLLSYLRYSDILEEKVIGTKDMVDKFFSSIYEREIERQKLPISHSEQEKIMSNLSALFCLFDITADTRENVKNALYEINEDIIKGIAVRKDEIDSLLNKLTNHALLDRHQSGLVGFINDFIYGSLLAKAFAENSIILSDLESLTMGSVLKIIEASEFLDSEDREKIAMSLKGVKTVTKEIRFEISHRLQHEINDSFSNIYSEDTKFKDVIFCTTIGFLKTSTFIQCSFEDCIFNWKNIKDCQFISCDFTNSSFEGDPNSCEFYECINSPQRIVEIINEEFEFGEEDLDREILTKFFRTGTVKPRIRHISGILREFNERFSRRNVMKHLSRLKAKEYIYFDGDNAWILQAGSEYLKDLYNNG